MRLRRATPADLGTLLAWDEEPDVLASSGEDDIFDWAAELPREVSWRQMLMAEVDGRPVGMIQIIDAAEEETHYWGACGPGLAAIDIWIGAAADRARGYGSEMMRLAIARCFSDPRVTAILVDPLASNVRAHCFYERLGFRLLERRRFGDDDCIVYRLERPLSSRDG